MFRKKKRFVAWDPSLYDMVVHIHKLHVADAAEIICHTVRLEQFITTPDSRKALDELALAARVKAAIVRDYPNADVTAGGQAVRVHLRASSAMEQKIVADVSDRVKRVPGVSDVSVHLIPMTLYD
jgi:1,6-anhydro-N-acetylmuramate kinase